MFIFLIAAFSVYLVVLFVINEAVDTHIEPIVDIVVLHSIPYITVGHHSNLWCGETSPLGRETL